MLTLPLSSAVMGFILYTKILAAGRKKRSLFDFWDIVQSLELFAIYGKKKNLLSNLPDLPARFIFEYYLILTGCFCVFVCQLIN